jgi:hypothetical protein
MLSWSTVVAATLVSTVAGADVADSDVTPGPAITLNIIGRVWNGADAWDQIVTGNGSGNDGQHWYLPEKTGGADPQRPLYTLTPNGSNTGDHMPAN